MKVCTKAHRSESFGEVPKGALFDDDAPAVFETPSAFKTVKDTATIQWVAEDEFVEVEG